MHSNSNNIAPMYGCNRYSIAATDSWLREEFRAPYIAKTAADRKHRRVEVRAMRRHERALVAAEVADERLNMDPIGNGLPVVVPTPERGNSVDEFFVWSECGEPGCCMIGGWGPIDLWDAAGRNGHDVGNDEAREAAVEALHAEARADLAAFEIAEARATLGDLADDAAGWGTSLAHDDRRSMYVA